MCGVQFGASAPNTKKVSIKNTRPFSSSSKEKWGFRGGKERADTRATQSIRQSGEPPQAPGDGRKTRDWEGFVFN